MQRSGSAASTIFRTATYGECSSSSGLVGVHWLPGRARSARLRWRPGACSVSLRCTRSSESVVQALIRATTTRRRAASSTSLPSFSSSRSWISCPSEARSETLARAAWGRHGCGSACSRLPGRPPAISTHCAPSARSSNTRRTSRARSSTLPSRAATSRGSTGTSQRGWMPSIAELESTVERHGSPVHDELFPGVVEAPGAADQEEALLRLIGDGFRVEEPRGAGAFADVEVDDDGLRRREGRTVRAGVRQSRSCGVDSRSSGASSGAGERRRPSWRGGSFSLSKEGRRGSHTRTWSPESRGTSSSRIWTMGRPWTLGMDSPTSPGLVRCASSSANDDSSHRGPRVTVRRWE